MDKRPNLNKRISIKDFHDFYWLKEELVIFCREIGISGNGGKIEIANRIYEYLKTGKVLKTKIKKTIKLPKPTHAITKETIIGFEHRSYKEKKEFFQAVIGKRFHFTVHLLEYFKKNSGKKTYSDFIKEWYNEQELKRDPNFVKEIAPQFEYNTYIREFLTDNPDKSKSDAIKYWKTKRAKRGDNKYSKHDLI